MIKLLQISLLSTLLSLIYLSPSFAEKSEYTGLPNQAYVELHMSYNQCKKIAKSQKYWELATQCIENKEKDCLNRTSHTMLTFTEENFSLGHCNVLKPSLEQLKQRVEELQRGEP